MAVVWFPADMWAAALARWPILADQLGVTADHAGYTRIVQQRLGRLRHQGIGRLQVAPFDLDAFDEWATTNEHDPATPAARAGYAAELAPIPFS